MEMATAIQGPVMTASLQQENEFLKAEIEAYKQELTIAREAYEKELNLYTLAHIASATERSADKDQYEEYMCSQCGDLYSRADYKVVEIPLSGPTPAVTPIVVKKESLLLHKNQQGL